MDVGVRSQKKKKRKNIVEQTINLFGKDRNYWKKINKRELQAKENFLEEKRGNLSRKEKTQEKEKTWHLYSLSVADHQQSCQRERPFQCLLVFRAKAFFFFFSKKRKITAKKIPKVLEEKAIFEKKISSISKNIEMNQISSTGKTKKRW